MYQKFTDLHEDVFVHLITFYPNLYFSMRGLDDTKLFHGYWFDNFKESINFSLWKGFDKETKANRISISITIEGELHIYLNARDSSDYANVFKIIAQTVQGFIQYNRYGKTENQWLKKYNGSWKESFKELIEQTLPMLKGFLQISEASIRDTTPLKEISKTDFEKYLERINGARKKLLGEQERKRQEQEQERLRQEEIQREKERKKVKKLRLTQLSLKNIGHFDQIALNLEKGVTVLIGENGSGKSTILRAIALAISGINIFNQEEDVNRCAISAEDITKWLKMIGTTEAEPTYADEGNVELNYIIDNQGFTNRVLWEKERRDRVAEVNNDFEHSDFSSVIEKHIQKEGKEQIQQHLVNLVIALPQGGGYAKPDRYEEELFPDPYALLPIIKGSAVDKIETLIKWIAANDAKADKEPEKDAWR